MSEIHAIMIGERGEYGRRLARYIEKHAPPSVRIFRFTSPEKMGQFRIDADYYIVEREFAPFVEEETGEDPVGETGRKGLRPPKGKRIFLSEEEEEGCFCRFRPPSELLDMMGLRDQDREGKDALSACLISAVYSPVFDENVKKIAMTFMEAGDLYLGFEDLGPVMTEGANVGDLCYYIHLREESILDTMEEICDKSQGIFTLESPDLFFYLRELSIDDYQWFFDQIRASGRYKRVFLGIGNGFLARPDVLLLLDRLYLVDSEMNPRQHALCSRLRWVVSGQAIGFRGDIKEISREQVLREEALLVTG